MCSMKCYKNRTSGSLDLSTAAVKYGGLWSTFVAELGPHPYLFGRLFFPRTWHFLICFLDFRCTVTLVAVLHFSERNIKQSYLFLC